jgi:hypothetical protein
MNWSAPKDWPFAGHLPTLSITQGIRRRMRGYIINNELERTWKEERKPGVVCQYSDYARLDSSGSESRQRQIFYL